jgi:hypothetical protein
MTAEPFSVIYPAMPDARVVEWGRLENEESEQGVFPEGQRGAVWGAETGIDIGDGFFGRE